MTLWKKEYTVKDEVSVFTVGNDYILDKYLLPFDCVASMAHAKMLHKIDLLSREELSQLLEGLQEIIHLSGNGEFQILPEDEDCHTAIEKYLSQKYGDAGKKIHTCRSRNDQVLTAMRLYEKDALKSIKTLIENYEKALVTMKDSFGSIAIPGYTHMQKAMPTSVKDWAECFIASNQDNLMLLGSVAKLIDQSPLGTAAGYGVPIFDIDRKMTADLMGFANVLENPIYAQMSRGKFESSLLHLFTQILFDANKIANDLMLFSTCEFGFVNIPVQFCTGSSIMPQKKNPDILELIRAKYHVVLAEEVKVKSLTANLVSGYNRDLQLIKEPVIVSVETVISVVKMLTSLVGEITWNEEKCKEAMTPELYATEEAYKLAKSGVPFRDAYKMVAKNL